MMSLLSFTLHGGIKYYIILLSLYNVIAYYIEETKHYINLLSMYDVIALIHIARIKLTITSFSTDYLLISTSVLHLGIIS